MGLIKLNKGYLNHLSSLWSKKELQSFDQLAITKMAKNLPLKKKTPNPLHQNWIKVILSNYFLTHPKTPAVPEKESPVILKTQQSRTTRLSDRFSLESLQLWWSTAHNSDTWKLTCHLHCKYTSCSCFCFCRSWCVLSSLGWTGTKKLKL